MRTKRKTPAGLFTGALCCSGLRDVDAAIAENDQLKRVGMALTRGADIGERVLDRIAAEFEVGNPARHKGAERNAVKPVDRRTCRAR